MDKTPKGPGESPELDDILDEFAPLSPADGAEPEEPTLRLLDREGRLVRQRPLDPAGGEKLSSEKPAREAAGAPEETKEEPENSPAPKKTKKEPKAAPAASEETKKGPRTAPAETEPEPEAAPEEAKAEPEEAEKRVPWWKRKPEPRHLTEKVIEFPEEDNSVTGRIGRLIEKGERYAEGMFAGDAPEDPDQAQRQRLLPGVDWEREPTHVPSPRRRRVARRPRPDVPPGKLAQRYKKGLPFLHTRTALSLLWCLPQLYLMLSAGLGLPLPAILTQNRALCLQISALAMGISALLALDVLAHGVTCLVRLRLEGETLVLFAVAAAAADALTMPVLGDRGGGMPYCAIVSLCLFFALWGRLLKRRGLWLSCRTAAAAAEPYLVTLDEKMWDGRDAFVKWPGKTEGYGSQIQETDGVQRAYHIAAPLLLLAAALLTLIATVGRRRPENFFWCLSACLTAGCGLAGALSFAMPFASLAQRLSKVGAALGGWDGLSWRGRNRGVVLTDADLFPPGSVTLNGIKLTGDVSLENAVAYTATLVRETGSGMEKPFADLLKTKGGLYRRASRVVFHEGGITGEIGGRQVCVGSGAFLELMHISVAPGLKVKGAVFCAVDGYLCAIFVLNHALHTSIRPALNTLIDNGLDPILATRDFLIIPEVLRQRFKLPADRMEFPSLDRRRELSSRRQKHERTLSAVLCREGLGPYADAVVGGKRLLRAVRLGLFFDLLGSAVGMALSFYLCLAQAVTALSAGALLVFLLLWLVPAGLIAGWVNRY